MKQELRLSGTGGQGLITAGIILAEAALLDGKLAIQSQSYGPEARGGASKAEVIISDEAIHFPKVTDPNLLLAMSQEAATKYSHDLTAGSVMITDSLFVSDVPDFGGKVYELPITHSAPWSLPAPRCPPSASSPPMRCPPPQPTCAARCTPTSSRRATTSASTSSTPWCRRR